MTHKSWCVLGQRIGDYPELKVAFDDKFSAFRFFEWVVKGRVNDRFYSRFRRVAVFETECSESGSRVCDWGLSVRL